jgi:hypothetical protein
MKFCAIDLPKATFILGIIGIYSAMSLSAQGSALEAYLPGTWQNTALNHTEIWRQDGSILKGNGYALNGQDTLFDEWLVINLAANPIVYTAWVHGQNDGAGIEFKLSEATDTSWLFENSQHDFPKKIYYIRRQASTLEVFITGLDNNQVREEHFHFIRKED